MTAPYAMLRRAALTLCAALALLLATATAAGASHWLLDGRGQPIHLGGVGHAPTIGLENDATNPYVRTAFYRALLAWQTPGHLGIIEMPTGSGTHVRAVDGYWGSTGWAGQAAWFYLSSSGVVVPGYDADGHTHHWEARLNMTYLDMAHLNNQEYFDAVACHEVGHSVAAVGEQTGADASCMAVGYSAPWDSWRTDARYRNPSAHDRDHVAYLWSTLH
jgi:hypothetical protein